MTEITCDRTEKIHTFIDVGNYTSHLSLVGFHRQKGSIIQDRNQLAARFCLVIKLIVLLSYIIVFIAISSSSLGLDRTMSMRLKKTNNTPALMVRLRLNYESTIKNNNIELIICSYLKPYRIMASSLDFRLNISPFYTSDAFSRYDLNTFTERGFARPSPITFAGSVL